MTISHKEFPVSYRLSQGMVAFCMGTTLLFARTVARNAPPRIAIILTISMIGLLVAAFLVSNYVIIRYPFLGIVESDGTDPFTKYFSIRNSWVYVLLRWFGMFAIVVMIASIIMLGKTDPGPVGVAIYMVFMLGFLLFLTFGYSPERYPAVATYLRATAGVGLVFFPLFIPALIIGTIRANQILDEADRSHADDPPNG